MMILSIVATVVLLGALFYHRVSLLLSSVILLAWTAALGAAGVWNIWLLLPLADLIIYGIEGVHYEITEDGFLDANAGSSPDTYSTLNWLYPNQFASTVLVGNTADLWERTETFNNEAIKSPALGFALSLIHI